jgi:arylsulfatase A-like enzyme
MVSRSLLALFALVLMTIPATAAGPRNIVLIYADDLGYGDVSCNGATAVQTPNVDRVAREGLRFTDGHSSSATCTPSRYALLTGEYPWRKKGTGVLPGDARLIIEPGRTTLATQLQRAGYKTGVVGKWHLGLGAGNLDWNGDIAPGPLDLGFDYNFLIPATGDRVPCVYVENRRVVGLDPNDPIRVSFRERIGDDPIGAEHPELLKLKYSHGHDRTIVNGISRIGYMSGGKAARWVDEDMADVITQKAVAFVEKHRAEPFFLFFSTHDIHVPRVPHSRFVGRTKLGPRGDAIVQFDWCVGEVLKALDQHGLTQDTLVILSSDNGPVIDDGYADDAVAKLGEHKPAGPFRGGKYSSFEGGTRVPFVIRWPARVKPGVSEALVCQIDLLASLSTLTGQKLVDADAPDSIDVLPALLGESSTGRTEFVEHARVLSLRDGTWKYTEPTKGPKISANTNTELGGDAAGQLFDLASDPGERQNVIADHVDRARKMRERLQQLRNAGRSRAMVDR